MLLRPVKSQATICSPESVCHYKHATPCLQMTQSKLLLHVLYLASHHLVSVGKPVVGTLRLEDPDYFIPSESMPEESISDAVDLLHTLTKDQP